MRHDAKLLIATLVAAFSLDAQSATASSDKTTSDSAQISRIAGQYSNWAGSNANAVSLVSGLRHGSSITLLPAAQPGIGITPQTTSVSFTPETKPMGWGNVTKALSLAQANLAAKGITNPTPQQLQAALTGGDINSAQGASLQTTHFDGILAMRNQGMGWGQVAHNLNLKPGAAFKPSGQTHNVRTVPDGGMADPDRDMLEDHHEHLLSNAVAPVSSRASTATGQPPTVKHDVNLAHTTHPSVSRVVNASGAPMATSVAYQHTEHGIGHAESNFTSHVTTATGNGISAGLGHAGNPGKAMGHGNN